MIKYLFFIFTLIFVSSCSNDVAGGNYELEASRNLNLGSGDMAKVIFSTNIRMANYMPKNKKYRDEIYNKYQYILISMYDNTKSAKKHIYLFTDADNEEPLAISRISNNSKIVKRYSNGFRWGEYYLLKFDNFSDIEIINVYEDNKKIGELNYKIRNYSSIRSSIKYDK